MALIDQYPDHPRYRETMLKHCWHFLTAHESGNITEKCCLCSAKHQVQGRDIPRNLEPLPECQTLGGAKGLPPTAIDHDSALEDHLLTPFLEISSQSPVMLHSFTGWKPDIVCLCGSSRFLGEFERISREETLNGKIVLNRDVPTGDETPDIRARLDELHRYKIAMSDEVIVINKDNSIDEATRAQVEYAKSIGKKVTFTDPVYWEGRHRSQTNPRKSQGATDNKVVVFQGMNAPST